jgi:hypothetical protein
MFSLRRMIMNLFDIIITFITIYITYKALKNSGKSLENDEIDPDEVPEKQEVIVCCAELIENHLYIWNKKDDSFITQGKNMDEVVQHFIKHYPNKKIYLQSDNENDYEEFKEKFNDWKSKTKTNR